MATGGSVCHFYSTPRGCWYGDRCRFIHDAETSVAQPCPEIKTKRCRYYRLPSGCTFGDMCSFRHDDLETRVKQEYEDVSCQMKQMSIYDEKHTYEGLEKEEPSCRGDYDDYSHDDRATPDQSPSTVTSKYENKDKKKRCIYCRDSDDDSDDDDDDEGCEHYENSREEGEEEEKAEAEEQEEEEDGCEGAEGWSADSDDEPGRAFDKWRAEKVDKQKPEISKATCGECGSLFLGEDAFDMLWTHYLDRLRKVDFGHLHFLSKDARFGEFTTCIICERGFARARDLLQHTVDKSKRTDKDGEEHMLVVENGIVEPFCYRDTVYHDEERLMEELILTLYNNPLEEVNGEVDFVDFLKFSLMFGGGGGHGPFAGHDSDSDDGGMFGFTGDQVNELLSQGVKPWDDEAADVLAALYDWDD